MSNVTERELRTMIASDGALRVGGTVRGARVAMKYNPPVIVPKTYEAVGYKVENGKYSVIKGKGPTQAAAENDVRAQGGTVGTRIPSPALPAFDKTEPQGRGIVDSWVRRMIEDGLYLPCPANQKAFEDFFAHRGLAWTSKNLDSAFAELNADGKLVQPPSSQITQPAGPTPEELEEKAREAQQAEDRKIINEANSLGLQGLRIKLRNDKKWSDRYQQALERRAQ